MDQHGGPSDQDMAEAHRLQVLHRQSAAVDACLWCREAWPCRFRTWADEVMAAAGAADEPERDT